MNSTTLADSHNSIYTSHRRKLGSRAVSTGLIQCARREPKRPHHSPPRNRRSRYPLKRRTMPRRTPSAFFGAADLREGPAMTRDRATVVTQVLVDALVDVMTTIIRTEFRRRITEILRDEFSAERQQGVADRGVDDA